MAGDRPRQPRIRTVKAVARLMSFAQITCLLRLCTIDKDDGSTFQVWSVTSYHIDVGDLQNGQI